MQWPVSWVFKVIYVMAFKPDLEVNPGQDIDHKSSGLTRVNPFL